MERLRSHRSKGGTPRQLRSSGENASVERPRPRRLPRRGLDRTDSVADQESAPVKRGLKRKKESPPEPAQVATDATTPEPVPKRRRGRSRKSEPTIDEVAEPEDAAVGPVPAYPSQPKRPTAGTRSRRLPATKRARISAPEKASGRGGRAQDVYDVSDDGGCGGSEPGSQAQVVVGENFDEDRNAEEEEGNPADGPLSNPESIELPLVDGVLQDEQWATINYRTLRKVVALMGDPSWTGLSHQLEPEVWEDIFIKKLGDRTARASSRSAKFLQKSLLAVFFLLDPVPAYPDINAQTDAFRERVGEFGGVLTELAKRLTSFCNYTSRAGLHPAAARDLFRLIFPLGVLVLRRVFMLGAENVHGDNDAGNFSVTTVSILKHITESLLRLWDTIPEDSLPVRLDAKRPSDSPPMSLSKKATESLVRKQTQFKKSLLSIFKEVVVAEFALELIASSYHEEMEDQNRRLQAAERDALQKQMEKEEREARHRLMDEQFAAFCRSTYEKRPAPSLDYRRQTFKKFHESWLAFHPPASEPQQPSELEPLAPHPTHVPPTASTRAGLPDPTLAQQQQQVRASGTHEASRDALDELLALEEHHHEGIEPVEEPAPRVEHGEGEDVWRPTNQEKTLMLHHIRRDDVPFPTYRLADRFRRTNQEILHLKEALQEAAKQVYYSKGYSVDQLPAWTLRL